MPWAIPATGGALAVTGSVLQVLASQNFRAYDEQFQLLACWSIAVHRGCPEAGIPAALTRRLERAEQQKRLAITSYIIGGSLLAAGVALLYLERSRSAKQEARRRTVERMIVSPSMMDGMVGLWIQVNR